MLKTIRVLRIVVVVFGLIMLIFFVNDTLFRGSNKLLLDPYDILFLGYIMMICSSAIIYLEALCRKNLPKEQHQSLYSGYISLMMSVLFTLQFIDYLENDVLSILFLVLYIFFVFLFLWYTFKNSSTKK